jgi:hypothetical protein
MFRGQDEIMTDSQFEALRQELRGMRGDFDQSLRAIRSDFDQRFDGVNQRFDGVGQRFDGVETRLTKLEVQLDAKPDKAFVFQTLFTINATFIAVIGLALLIFRSFIVPA